MDVPLTTRPVRIDDEERFRRLWPRLSPDTVHRRFHGPLRCLPPELVHRLVDVDHELREALVATVGDEVVGVARYDRSPADPASADFAVVVEDAWQGVGVGRQLLAEILELAARRGVRTATALVQADNERMVGLIRRLLPAARFRTDAATYAVAGPLPDRTTAVAPRLAAAAR